VANWTAGRSRSSGGGQRGRPRCAKCRGLEHGVVPAAPYACLLGLYLGDGCLAAPGRQVWLCFALDAAYPGIVSECRRTISEVLPHRRSNAREPPRERCVLIRAYGREWLCLFPQHGPGRKHHRDIVLEPWQLEIVDANPGLFLRGLVHSDGWRGLNRVRVKGRDYAYPRYQFSNRSDDIRGLFTYACDLLGIDWRPWGPYHISVARRESVALLDRFVGPKR
jgi:hypothetical protein